MVGFEPKPLTVTAFERRADAEILYFRFGQDGWAFLLLDEPTGIVAIYSDHGNFTFAWPPSGRGEGVSLKSFLASTDTDYLACKFVPTRDAFDMEATAEDIKRQIFRSRRLRYLIDKTKARELYDDIEAARYEDMGPELFLERMSRELTEFLGDAPYEFLRYDHSMEWKHLKFGLLPPMIAEIRKLLKTPDPETAA